MLFSYPESVSNHLWQAAKQPEPQWDVETFDLRPCATCGVETTAGVAVKNVDNPTFSRHADFLKFGESVCVACAWMYSDPKRRHRSVLAIGDDICWPALGAESAVDGRPTWSAVIDHLATAAASAPVSGVMTTDPKPRLWPLARLSTVARLGLYVHAPDYDLSSYVELDRFRLVEVRDTIARAVVRGVSKRACARGLLSHNAFSKEMSAGLQLENELRPMRLWPEFIPALLATLVQKTTAERAS